MLDSNFSLFGKWASTFEWKSLYDKNDINELVLSTLKTRLKYAFSYDSLDYTHDLILNESHINLAREVSEESMVLIKNENTLPFQLGENLKIGVIGRLADTENT